MINRRRFLGTTALASAWLAHPSLAQKSPSSRELAEELSSFGGSPTQIADDEDFWRPVQRQFSVDRSLIHLNTGGVCPTLKTVQNAESAHQRQAYRRPFYAHMSEIEPQLELVRCRLASELGCDPDELALTRNTSEGMEICQLGFKLNPGDEILTTVQDYPRMLHTWQQRVERERIVLKKVPIRVPLSEPETLIESLEAAITPRTRLIMCCHMIDLTGQILPVARIGTMARRHGLPLLVDGAQTFGHLDFKLDDLNCDFFATSLHKWLLGPHGTGLLYVRRDRIGEIWPLMPASLDERYDIQKFEDVGTQSPAKFLALGEAMTFRDVVGAERIEARLKHLRGIWLDELVGCDRISVRTFVPDAGALTTIDVEGIDPVHLRDFLWAKHRIRVRPIKHEAVRGIRVSAGLHTTRQELEYFVSVMRSIVDHGIN